MDCGSEFRWPVCPVVWGEDGTPGWPVGPVVRDGDEEGRGTPGWPVGPVVRDGDEEGRGTPGWPVGPVVRDGDGEGRGTLGWPVGPVVRDGDGEGRGTPGWMVGPVVRDGDGEPCCWPVDPVGGGERGKPIGRSVTVDGAKSAGPNRLGLNGHIPVASNPLMMLPGVTATGHASLMMHGIS